MVSFATRYLRPWFSDGMLRDALRESFIPSISSVYHSCELGRLYCRGIDVSAATQLESRAAGDLHLVCFQSSRRPLTPLFIGAKRWDSLC